MHQINQVNLEQNQWVEGTDESRGTYKVNSQIKFKISMLRSRLCNYSDVHMLESAAATVPNAAAAHPNKRKKYNN